ncbi:hypothetical protein [Psychromonas ingrahamii]|uniref:hypothetical protein n=1 Tax=Psychromonas ingrahamii TaxID=357794 RepID=UPI0005A147AE|nr:hypothetical protein [Psychromonas ingrahamii]
MLEVVLAISQKVISHYLSHLAEMPVDRAFEEYNNFVGQKKIAYNIEKTLLASLTCLLAKLGGSKAID